jgi:hypothetical protein
VGGAWAGDANSPPPAPRFLDVAEFIAEAAAVDAVVLLALQDSSTATGELQQLLGAAGVAHTGVYADYALQCANRITLSKVCEGWEGGWREGGWRVCQQEGFQPGLA